MNDTPYENRIDLTALQASTEKSLAGLSRQIIGQAELLKLMYVALLANEHVLVEGVPGVAKTLAARLLARSVDAGFSRIQFTPDLMPSDIIGTSVYYAQKERFEFNPGPVFSNIILTDEINRAPAKTQSALFEVMQERQATVDGTTYPMDQPYMVIATQNPIEQEGTYQLPEAQLDRFLFKLLVSYPAEEDELNLLKHKHGLKGASEEASIEAGLKKDEIIQYQQLVHEVHIEEKLLSYLSAIIRKTRKHPSLYLGASPRAAVLLMHAAKAYAAVSGRDFVAPEDIKTLTPHVLRHRILLSPEKEMEGMKPDDVIQQLLTTVEVPK